MSENNPAGRGALWASFINTPSATYSPVPIGGDFRNKHIVSVLQFDKRDLRALFSAARNLKKRVRSGDRGVTEIANGRVMALLFFESSTRTDLSFQAAMARLGGKVVSASNGIKFSSAYKGEDLSDTVRAAGCYADVIVLRHPQVGASHQAARYLDMLATKIGRNPAVISGGDGEGEHPTQALLDLFTILDRYETVDGLTITLAGDLLHGRTVHSLARLLAAYKPQGLTVGLASPTSLSMPEVDVAALRGVGVTVVETSDIHDLIGLSDVIYWTRVQEERFANRERYEQVKEDFIMTPGLMESAKRDAILMHPLPRKHEMGTLSDQDALDADPRSAYFQQMENGMFVRMALLAKVLNDTHV